MKKVSRWWRYYFALYRFKLILIFQMKGKNNERQCHWTGWYYSLKDVNVSVWGTNHVKMITVCKRWFRRVFMQFYWHHLCCSVACKMNWWQHILCIRSIICTLNEQREKFILFYLTHYFNSQFILSRTLFSNVSDWKVFIHEFDSWKVSARVDDNTFDGYHNKSYTRSHTHVKV